MKAEREWTLGQYYDGKQYYGAARQYYQFLVENYPQTPFAEQARAAPGADSQLPRRAARITSVADAGVRPREIVP